MILNDITCRDHTFFFNFDGKDARFFFIVAEFNLLEVENDVGDILDHSRKTRELMLHAGNFHRSNGSTLKRGEQDAAQRVTDRVAVAALKRFCDKLRVSVGCGILVANETIWKLETSKCGS